MKGETVEKPHVSATHDSLSRRQFVKASGAIAASAAALSAVGCAPGTEIAETGGENNDFVVANPEEGGEWVSAACWHNCGGRCMNKVMVKDGVVVRQKTDDTHEDSFDYPQQRGCVRGKAQQQQCFGADRLLYPMKRKNWSPENPNGDLRGKDEWERISWDEAIKYVADQFKTIIEKYGVESILVGGLASRSEAPYLNAIGGHTSISDSTSHGVYNMPWPQYIGITNMDLMDWTTMMTTGNDRMDLLNADTVLFYSSNPAWSAAGTPIMSFIRAKENGTKFISVDPMYTASAHMLDADWVPVRTGTDTAFLLGVASEMLRLDEEEGNIVDWDFLDKYTVGFDADHKPTDLKEDVNFRDYLAGAYDGIPKTAQWASGICGTPVEKITEFARSIGKAHNVWMLHNFGMARCTGAENIPQLFMTITAMGGHIGKPGNCMSSNYHQMNCGNSGPYLVLPGAAGLPVVPNPVEGVIPGPQAWDAVFSGKYHYCGDFYGGVQGVPGEDRTCDIHCIVHDTSAYLQTGPNMKRGIEAHRKVDFVVSKAQFLTTNAKYSDIVLPVNTEWERPGRLDMSNREFLSCASQVIEPLGESKSDQEINTLLLEALGVDPMTVYPFDEKQGFFNSIATSMVMGKEGYGPLVTITEQDIAEWGVEGTPQEGVVALADFIKNGGYQVERKLGDEQSQYIGYAAFIADPEANPLPSNSGKFEICSQAKADGLNQVGFSNHDYKPYPEYLVPEVGYESTFAGGDIGGEKGEYPFLLFTPHYMRRSHSVFNNCPWLRESWPNPVFLNAADAAAKGVAEGDTVRVWTEFGSVLRTAALMENMMPGHVGIPHGAWSNVDEETGIDHGGADNYLIGNHIYGMGVTGYNNNNCNFEKYAGESIEPDCMVDQRIIELA